MNEKATGDRLRAAATGQAIAKKIPESFPQMLTAFKGQIAMALPKHISGDRMLRVALTCFRQNPKLGDCDPKSVFAAVIVGAQLGLEPGILGQGYLVPYKQKNGPLLCQFIPGWQGLVDLVNRSGRASVWTGAVYKGDEFEYEYGSSPHIHHKPSVDGGDETNPESLLYVYAVGQVKGSDFPVIEVQSNLKVRRHRDRYNKVGDRHYSYENFEQYARKVALLQVLKYMPKSIEMASAIGASYSADAGQVIDLKEAMDNTFLPAPVAELESVDTNTGEISKGKPEVDLSVPELAISMIKQASTEEAVGVVWREIVAAHQGQSVPIQIEAAKHDRIEFIQARDAKARG
jgi:recombination protein RecT